MKNHMQITSILKKLEKFFTDQHSIGFAQLQDGISQVEIEERIAPFNLSFPPEVFELFKWKNGIKESSDETIVDSLLFPWGIMESMDRLVDVYKSFTSEGYFSKEYFPLFTSGGGDYILVNCNKDDDFYRYVYWHSLALYGTELDARYDSLSTLLQCVLECFEAGAYYFEGGALEIKEDLADSILEKYQIPEV